MVDAPQCPQQGFLYKIIRFIGRRCERPRECSQCRYQINDLFFYW
ncbi:hypothetical protein SJ05684_b50980 (plasmid) [Sinorhizobium sojae CCBAU 05684]|uniref:Uncharacterized protein n=1 Tax=Sinorhizobium sojae CCBAU 05684 TaxID=716928 RepID=A0A249PJG1_9HYPH|nr:hypothetical protein SJ05684_b50980 [Sinorhizobium sojae CCBAU 05684]